MVCILGGWFGISQLAIMAGLSPPSYKLKKARNMFDRMEIRMHLVKHSSNEILLNTIPMQTFQDESTIGPAAHYVPPIAILQDRQALNYTNSSSVNTSKRLTLKPLQVFWYECCVCIAITLTQIDGR